MGFKQVIAILALLFCNHLAASCHFAVMPRYYVPMSKGWPLLSLSVRSMAAPAWCPLLLTAAFNLFSADCICASSNSRCALITSSLSRSLRTACFSGERYRIRGVWARGSFYRTRRPFKSWNNALASAAGFNIVCEQNVGVGCFDHFLSALPDFLSINNLGRENLPETQPHVQCIVVYFRRLHKQVILLQLSDKIR